MRAYVIAEIGGRDPDAPAAYRARVPAIIERHGGRLLLRGIEQEAEGQKRGAPELLAIAFPTLAKARAFMADPDAEAAALVSSGGLTLRLLAEDPAPAASEGLRPDQLTSDNHD